MGACEGDGRVVGQEDTGLRVDIVYKDLDRVGDDGAHLLGSGRAPNEPDEFEAV